MRTSRLAIAMLATALLAGCASEGAHVELTYELGAIAVGDVARIETIIHVDPKDGRQFFVDQPYRSIALGVGYEVRDLDGDGVREVVLMHDASLGYVFTQHFSFRVLPPANGEPPPLLVRAKAYGSSTSLGEANPTEAVFSKGGKATLLLASTLCGQVTCSPSQTCCDDHCIDTSKSERNCGGCGMACGAEADACSGGVCRCAGGAACGDGQTCCDGVGCADLQQDRFNCGACGKTCNPGESCVAGACKCGSNDSCGDGGLCCVLDNGASCSTTGSCACGGSVECTSPAVCCNAAAGLCADLMDDKDNCGACGRKCPAGLICKSGSCRCAGQICASGDACCTDGCKTLKDDPANCGACGKKCRAGEACVAGACTCGSGAASDTCTEAESCCGAACTNTSSDGRNCGACGVECKPGETCAQGACKCNGGNACAVGRTCCPNIGTSPGGCVDLSSDPNNCMDCGHVCPPGNACLQGTCVPTSCNPACTNGNTCSNGVCVCKGAASACAGNFVCCEGSGCVDTTSDPTHCAKCGNPCPVEAPNCCNSACVSTKEVCLGSGTSCGGILCPPGQSCCNDCGTTTGAGSGSGSGSGFQAGSAYCGDVCPDIVCSF